jgi:hypothetical protein
MDSHTYAAFLDELVKIASPSGPNEQVHQQVAVNSSVNPLDQAGKNGDWDQKELQGPNGEKRTAQQLAKEYADRIRKAAKESPTARQANNFFGLPLETPPKRGVKKYDEGSSSAAGPDRSQSPVDAQSTPNVAASNRVSPASGPGGV